MVCAALWPVPISPPQLHTERTQTARAHAGAFGGRPCIACGSRKFTGAPGRTRTCDPLIRRQPLYPPELRAHRHKVIETRERVGGIEPPQRPWKGRALPLGDTRNAPMGLPAHWSTVWRQNGAAPSEHWSGRPDLNRRPRAPKARALPSCATPRPTAHTAQCPTDRYPGPARIFDCNFTVATPTSQTARPQRLDERGQLRRRQNREAVLRKRAGFRETATVHDTHEPDQHASPCVIQP